MTRPEISNVTSGMTHQEILEMTRHSETDSTHELEEMESEARFRRNMDLVKWFMIQVDRLPKYTDERTKPWAVFETELRTTWKKTPLDRFPLALQKQAILGRIQGEASRIHSLLSEGSWAWTVGLSAELFLNHARDAVKAPARESMARLQG